MKYVSNKGDRNTLYSIWELCTIFKCFYKSKSSKTRERDKETEVK